MPSYLNILVGQDKARKAWSLAIVAAAVRLHTFCNCFDSKDVNSVHDTLRQSIQSKIDGDDINDNNTIVITEEEVYKVLKSINTHKAAGPDELRGWLVKNCNSSLLNIICIIYNLSLCLCRMPVIWKLGKIILVGKKPLPEVDNDLRPVILTAILAKCLERTILPKISECTKPIMHTLQFVHIPQRSTDDAPSTLLQELIQ